MKSFSLSSCPKFKFLRKPLLYLLNKKFQKSTAQVIVKKNLTTLVTPQVRYKNGEGGTGKGMVKWAFYALCILLLFYFRDENMFMYYWFKFKPKPKPKPKPKMTTMLKTSSWWDCPGEYRVQKFHPL